MDTKYSLTTLLNDLLKLQNNGYQIITKLSDVVSSNADTVEIDVTDSNGIIQKVYVPSFGSLKQQIVQLENNIKQISGIGEGDTSVQMSDGSFRKILVSSLQQEAQNINTLASPLNFNTKENWFFESFLNPLLYVSFDLTNQIKYNTENVEVARYILNLDTVDKQNLFSRDFLNKSDINYQSFVKSVIDNNISYFLDKSVIDMPPRTLRYNGDFLVMNVNDTTITQTINNAQVQKRALQLQLDKLVYNDNQSEYLGTMSLKIGDFIIVNSERKNTRFKIIGIETTNSTVSVELVEGFDKINIGTRMAFYGEDKSPVYSQVNVGFNENCVIFIKPIDPDSKIEAINWSPGVGIYTNALTLTDENGNTTDLATYYQNEVVDFGAFLYSSVKDKTTPAIFGVTPNVPITDVNNFKVLPINDHLTTNGNIENLQKLNADKLRVQSQVSALDKSISDLRTKVQTTKYSSQKLEDSDRNELSKLINERGSQSSLYASIIDDINTIAASESVENLNVKYRLRGFFPFPATKSSERSLNQEVVQFKIQYRYVKKDGSANQPQQIEFTDNNGTVRRGTFSTWNEYKTDLRRRAMDSTTGVAYWATDSMENADVVNINQIDIPIQQGEGVEFRIKSISEAGWPVTPIESDWTDIIRVDFPSEFESIPDANSIIEQARKESVRVELEAELVNMSLDKISNASFTQNGQFFTSASQQIASGFLTAENNVISLYEKLISIDSELRTLRGIIAAAKGQLIVRIVDDAGIEYSVTNNQTVKIFAGNYKDQVSSLTIKKGVIISKNYFVKITNGSASQLELYSRNFGSRYTIVNSSYTGGVNYNAQDTDYNLLRRYDYVPVGLSNPATTDIATYGFIRNTPEQSAQVLSQFINFRYKSVDGRTNLYSPINSSSTYGILDSNSIYYNSGAPVVATSISDLEHTLSALSSITFNGYAAGSPTTDFVWGGGTTNKVVTWTNALNFANKTTGGSLLVHINHPDIPRWQAAGSTAAANALAQNEIRNSVLASIPKGTTGSSIQTALFFEGIGSSANRYSKVGFESSDQYLIGPKSCGSYLFVNPNSHTELIVDGSDSLSLKTISFGNDSGLNIPLTYQYRMTDYFGLGDTGLGNVGGDSSANSSTNLEYTKTIGMDIYANPIDKDRFSFDLEITSRYYSKSLITKDIPVRTFETALDDLTKTIKVVTPRTSRDQLIRGGGGGCPDPMTPINITEELSVLAGTLNVGDKVYTMHETTKEFGFFEIIEATPITEEKLKITFTDNSEITVSDSHKFYMANEEWKRSYKLEVGESIKGYIEDKTIANIESIGIGTVIKFEIEDAHTYISNGLISHNKVQAFQENFQ